MWQDVRQLRKNLRTIKNRKSLRSENFVEYYFCIKEYFDMFFSAISKTWTRALDPHPEKPEPGP